MQEARRGQSGLGGAARRRHRLAAEFPDLQNRARHAGIQFAPRQRFTKTQGIEFGAGEFGAGVMFAQFAISGADAAGESFAFRGKMDLRKSRPAVEQVGATGRIDIPSWLDAAGLPSLEIEGRGVTAWDEG